MASDNEPWLRAWAKIAMVPLTAVILAGAANYSINNATVAKDYVGLAVQILQTQPKTESDSALRGWAVNLLDQYSAVKLTAELKQSLRNGTTTFPQPEDVRQLLSELNNQLQERGRAQLAAIAGIALPRKRVPEETIAVVEELSKSADPEIRKRAQDLLSTIRKQ
jgi:hypothetical protein